ncbi:protein TolQ [Candidatus Hepatincolaceae symbiont of Richtersius coronifer]
MNNFGIVYAFLHATIINKLVFITLILLSVFSWALIIKKYLLIRKAFKNLKEAEQAVSSQNPRMINTYLLSTDYVATEIIRLVIDANKDKNAVTKEEIKQRCELLLEVNVLELQKNVEYLATLSNVAPFVGLFGTVLGVISSFNQIGATSSASLAVIAPGISEALYATAIGLFVAIPASVFYNTINIKISQYMEQQRIWLEEVFYTLYNK